MIIYTATKGDTLYSIARRYGVTLSELERFNMLPDNSRISVGQDILIPVNNKTYTVKPGDSVFSIAVKEGISTADILPIGTASFVLLLRSYAHLLDVVK